MKETKRTHHWASSLPGCWSAIGFNSTPPASPRCHTAVRAKIFMFYHVVLLLSLVSTGYANVSWQPVDQLLREAVEKRVFPGAVALVADEGGVLYKTAVGALTYGQKTPRATKLSLSISSSIFDMASCTKVIATTSAISLLFQELLWKKVCKQR